MPSKVRSTTAGSPPEQDDTCAADEPITLTAEQAQTLVLDTIQHNAEAFLRTARRHSLCADDAQEAYQRAMEIFLRRARTLDPDRAAAWVQTVTKHEAMAVRRQRQQIVGAEEFDFDRHEARHLPSSDEQIIGFDELTRSAEALQRLKPNEMRALWLKASGQSYNGIAEAQGWSYTKVNRLITEGRRAFLKRYADIEAGRECERWAGVISALIDGEATAAMLTDARPHLRNCPACRATVRELRRANASLAIVLPVTTTTAMAAGSHHEPVSGLAMRLYEAVTGGVHERVATSALKIQAGVEAASAGKVAAVVAASAAVAGGGIAVIKQDLPVQHARVRHAHTAHVARALHAHPAVPTRQRSQVIAASLPVTAHHRTSTTATHVVHHRPVHHEFDAPVVHRTRKQVTSEFVAAPVHAASAAPAPVVHVPAARTPVPTSAGVAKGGEFGP